MDKQKTLSPRRGKWLPGLPTPASMPLSKLFFILFQDEIVEKLIERGYMKKSPPALDTPDGQEKGGAHGDPAL